MWRNQQFSLVNRVESEDLLSPSSSSILDWGVTPGYQLDNPFPTISFITSISFGVSLRIYATDIDHRKTATYSTQPNEVWNLKTNFFVVEASMIFDTVRKTDILRVFQF